MGKFKYDINIEEAIELYNSGSSTKELADLYNCPVSILLYHFRKNNVILRPASGVKKNLDDNYIVEQYLTGRSMKEISIELNVDSSVIKRVLRENQVELRSTEEISRLKSLKTKGIKQGYRLTDDEITPNKRGYLARHIDGKTIQLHRLVMEAILGRPLLDTETVHHKNGDRADNRPENLELWSHSQPYGQRVEDKVVWAKEIINIYDSPFLEEKNPRNSMIEKIIEYSDFANMVATFVSGHRRILVEGGFDVDLADQMSAAVHAQVLGLAHHWEHEDDLHIVEFLVGEEDEEEE